jgi:glycosyltransferase involved in cell wall biosynthesis
MELVEKDYEYILITSQNFPRGGAGAAYLNLFCRGLKLNGCSIRVLLIKGFAFGSIKNNDHQKNVTDYGVPFRYLGLIRRPGNKFLKLFDDLKSVLSLVFILFSFLKKRKSVCLLIYNNELQSNIIIYSFASFFRIRLITFVPEYYDRSDFRDSFFRKLKWYGFLFNFKHLNRRSDRLIVFSYYLKDQYLKQGFPEHKVIVQPNLTDFDYWEPENSSVKYTIGYCGAPYLKDGLLDLFKAINLLQKQDLYASLLVVGDSTFGKSLLPDLKTKCSSLGISEKVIFTGLVETPAVKQYLSQCQLLAITRPSTIQTKAGFPTKLGEYFAVKRPVLVTDFGDINRYFQDGVDLVIAEAGNPESIASKIKFMLQNKEISDQISQSGYVKAKELLGYQKSVIRLIHFISSTD